MGLWSSHLESLARSKEARGETATLERWSASMLTDQAASNRQSQSDRAQRRELQRHREMLQADQNAFLEKMDRIQNPEKYVEIDRLQEEARDQETREEMAREIAQLLQKAEWDDEDRLSYLFSHEVLLSMSMEKDEELSLCRAIGARPGNESIDRGDIEFMQQFQDAVLKVKSPRPLTASYVRGLMGVELAPENISPAKGKQRGIVWKLTKYLVVIPAICFAAVMALVVLAS